MELFSSKAHLKRSSEPGVEEPTGCSDPSLLDSSSSITDIDTSGPVDEEFTRTAISNFEELGICQWLLQSTGAMGFRRPTPIQQACIPSILKGKDVMGCAETGSGKTAAFALPILQHLSEDPYGIFAVVLTPTRELAVQICEQFSSLGAPMGARVESIIGGMNMTEQSLKLARRPHVLVATPGRLRHHMLGADPPNLSKVRYVVLDEADRLLCDGFSSELDALLEAASHPKRQTLLFSATLSSSLQDLQRLATKETLRFDLTLKQRIPATLSQQLLFIPGRVKLAYLVAVLRRFLSLDSTAFGGKSDTGEDEELMSALAGSKRRTDSRDKKRKHKRSKKGQEAELEALLAKSSEMEGAESKSAMIFIGSCQRCAETVSTLTEMGVDCVALHSLLPQSKRLASLQRFRDSHSRVLVATDVASRGLDIPSVELVINYDLPRLPTDYVHRVGRAARAGRTGRSLSLVTPNDLNLVKAVEAHTGDQMQPSDEVTEDEVVAILNPVSKAMRVAQQRMLERGFEEQASTFLQRKKDQKKNLRRKREAVKTDTE